jgi:hypothetical protein
MPSLVTNSRYRLSFDPPPFRVGRARTAQPRGAGRYADDPAGFIDECIVIDDTQSIGGEAGVMPFRLWEAQRGLLEDMHREDRLLILKARQLGISWLCCAYALWLCLHKPGRVVLSFSKGQDEANELLRRVTVMYERLTPELRASLPTLLKANTEEIAWDNGSRVKSMPATPSAGRTFTASLAIMDEAAFMAYADRLYTALKPTIDGGGKLIILSTANGRSNLFYDLVQRSLAGAGRFVFRFLPWHVRPGRDAAWYDATAADAVDESHMKQEYPATADEAFEATDISTFLPAISLWDACRADLPPLDPHTPVILAMDAGESSDTFATGLISRWGEGVAVRYSRVYVPQGAPLDFDAIELDIRALVASYAVQQVAYDPMLLGQMMRRLSSPGRAIPTPLEPFPQGAARLEADKLLLDLITQRRIAHAGDEVLRQHIANADKKVDDQGRRLRIVKRTHALKIDAAVMLSMGCARAMEVLMHAPAFDLSYDTRRRR